MKLLYTFLVLTVTLTVSAQTFTHPITGIANENVGSCLTATCTGTYTDNGGAAGNYSNNINQVYRVFCPNAAGNCVRLTFNSFAMEGMIDPAGPNPLDCYFDYLTVGNGSTQNSPAILQAPFNGGLGLGRMCGTPATPMSYTSTNANGCLSVRHTTDFSNTAAGWSATVSCVPCAGPNGTDNNDCANRTALCNSAPVGTNASGPGISAEGCTGVVCPAGGENHSNWYTFTAQTSGTLNVVITPVTATDDYDYAIFGPGATCASLGTPLRCSDSGATGVTGTQGAALDVSEDVTGDKFTSTLNVVAGQTFIMMVDEWTPNTGGGYTLSFGGSTASLDCTVLPVELLKFEAIYLPKDDAVDVYWITETENNNDFFDLEKSYDGVKFDFVKRMDGQGTSPYETQYFVNDTETRESTIYYRIKQVDLDGNTKYSRVTSVNILAELKNQLYMYPNPTNGNVNITFSNKTEEVYEMVVMDAKGFVVETRMINATVGLDNNAEIDLTNFKKGIYFVSISNSSRRLSGKIIKN